MLMIDYDLSACLECNPQSFYEDDIEAALAVWEGERDGDAWRWILRLKDGRTMFLKGACNYTGWECKSWARSHIVTDLDFAFEDDEDVYNSLMNQLVYGKEKTWSEAKDEEFGYPNRIAIPHKAERPDAND